MEKSPSLVLTQTLDLPAAVAGFYIQESVLSMINNMKQGSLYFRLEDDIHALHAMHKKYTSQLAGAFFDYISLACFGEARHAINQASFYIHQICYKWNTNDDQENVKVRTKSYRHSLKFDPHLFLPTLVELFETGEWKDNSYGGQKWADIAKAGLMYNDMPDTVFIDHAVDLSHNGGSMFNKDILFLQHSAGNYLRMLDDKRHLKSILVNDFLQKFPIALSVKPFLKMASKFGLIDIGLIYGKDYREIVFPDIIEWGLLPIKITDILPLEKLSAQLEKSDGYNAIQYPILKHAALKHAAHNARKILAPEQTSFLALSA